MIIVGISIYFRDSDYYRFTNLGKKKLSDEHNDGHSFSNYLYLCA